MSRPPAGQRVRSARRHRSLRLVHPSIQELERRQLLAGASIHVSDLPFVSASNDYGPVERDQTNGASGAHDGQTISLRGVTYSKGLGTHANSDVKIALDGIYDQFHAVVGVDDDAGGYGTVVFQVWADGAKLYDSGVVGGGTSSSEVNVDVRGRLVLDLIVTDAGDGFNNDHADWADAQLRLASSDILPGDASFEDVALGDGVYTMAPTGSAWSFTGSAGIAGYGSGWSGAYGEQAPDGRQAALLQGSTASISQVVTGWAAGFYRIAFSASQAGYVDQNFEVLVDNVNLGSYRPTYAKNQYERFTTAEFTVPAGSHAITFRAINSSGGANNAALIDDVAIEAFRSPDPSVGDGSFEAVDVGPLGYEVNPRSGTWTFQGPAGVALNQSAIAGSNPASPSGGQVGFLQKSGSFTQTAVGWLGGPYQVVFSAAQRASNSANRNLEVLVDGNVVGTFSPAGTAYQTYATPTFTVAAGQHELSFRAPDIGSGNDFVLIDDVEAGPVRPAILLNSGGSNTSRYEGGFILLPYTIRSGEDMNAYLAAHPIVANPVFDARFTPTSASYPAWFANGADSSWMAPTPGGMTPASLVPFLDPNGNINPDVGCPQGLFYYTTNFFVPAGANPSEVLGHWAIDNPGMAIFLNGVPQNDFTNDGIFYSFSTFRLDPAALRVGMNILTFVNLNGTYNATGGNPSGMRIEATLNLGLPVASMTSHHSLSGRVFADANNDGKIQPGEPGLAGVIVALAGVDALGNTVNSATRTGTDGSYSFAGLAPGTYSVAETHPTGLIDGKVNVGSLGGTARVGQISGIVVGAGDGSNYNFGLDRPPVFVTTPAAEVLSGNTFIYSPQAIDSDHDTLHYTLLAGPSNVTFDQQTGRIAWPTSSNSGNQSFRLLVDDGRGGSAEQNFTVRTVTTPNRPPIFTSTPIVDAYVGMPYSYKATAFDPDGDTLTFWLNSSLLGMTLVNPGSANSTTPDPTATLVVWTPTGDQVGAHTVSLLVIDGQGGSAEQNFEVIVHQTPGNHAPVIVSDPVRTYSPPLTYEYQVRAVDQDNDSLTYSLDHKPSEFMSIDPQSGLITWSYPSSSIAKVTVSVSDGRGGVDIQTYYITPPGVNVIGSTGDTPAGVEFSPFPTDGSDGTAGDRLLATALSGNFPHPFVPAVVGDYGTYTPKVDGNPIFNSVDDTAGTIYTVYGSTSGFYRVTFDVANFTDSPYLVVTANTDDVGAVYLNGHLLRDAQGNAFVFYEGGDYSVSSANTGWLVSGRNELLFVVNNSGGGPTGLSFEADLLKVDEHIAPKIKSTPPTAARVGVPFEYLVRVSNPSGDLVTYSLVSSTSTSTVPTGMTINPITGLITWTPAAGQVGPQLAKIVITNPFGQSDSQMLPLQVGLNEDTNTAPVLLNRPNFAAVGAGVPFTFEAVGFDADGDTVRYSLPAALDGMVIDPITGKLKWTPSARETGPQDFLIRLTDGRGGTNLYPFEVFVPGSIPTPVFTTHPSDQATVGQPYVYHVGAVDSDGDTITFLIDPSSPPPSGMGFLVDHPDVLVWTPDETGTTTVTIDASNGRGGIAQQVVTVTASAGSTGQAPSINSHYRQSIQVGRIYLYQVTAFNPSNAPLTYSLVNSPAGSSITQDGVFSWPTMGVELKSYEFSISVSNAYGSSTQPVLIQVKTQGQNHPPIIDPLTLPGAVVGQPYAFRLTGSDPDNDPLIWSLPAKLDGMAIDPISGLLVWTPTTDQIGTGTLTVRLRDGQGGSVDATLAITVWGANLPPQFRPDYPPSATQHVAYTYQVSAYDPEGGPLTYTLMARAGATLPTDLTIDHAGVIHWTNPVATPLSIIVRVKDDQGSYASQPYTLTVRPQAPPAPPVIDGSHLLDRAAVGSAYVSFVTATSADNHPVDFTLGSDHPANLTITAGGQIGWTPGTGQYSTLPTTVPVTLVATDRTTGATASLTYRITVRSANQKPIVSALGATTVVVQAPFVAQAEGTDPDGDPLRWSLAPSGGTPIPAGMTIDPITGRIDWIGTDQIRSYPVKVVATDPFGLTDEQTLTVNVVADTTNPTVQVVLSQPSPVVVGTRVTVVVSASDDAGIASRTLMVNGVAVVLDSNNAYSFVATQQGQVAFVATATDVNHRMGSSSAILEVFAVSTSAPQAALLSYRDAITVGATAQSFQPPTTVTAPVEIIGTAVGTDGTSQVTYTLEVRSLDGALLKTLRNQSTPDAVTDGLLGTFDPTMLANGSYILRLTVNNGSFTKTDEQVMNVTGRLKLGNLHLSFVDLVVPVAGIPITLTRSYDTLNASKLGDFGYGWTFGEGDFQLQISQPDGTLTGLDAHMPFHYGEHIVLTRPGKAPEGFTFLPEIVTTGGSTLPIGTQYYYAAFKADPGVADELMVSYTELIYDPESGDFLSTLDYGTPYNPADPTFGSNGQFTLQTRQGYKYVIDADSGRLASAIDRNNNTLTFDETGIYSSSDRFITFTRNSQGLIQEIKDQAGNRVTYDYDDDLNLIAVNDQWSNRNHADGMPLTPTQFFYRTAANAPQHYIDHITDALNRPAATTEYDDQGRLKKVIDASGKTTTYIWDSVGLVQQVTDQLGHTTTITLDTRGNVLHTVDPEGVTTVNTYDPLDHLKSQTTIVGQEDSATNGEHDDLKITYTYVGDDLKQMIDPRGNVTFYDYNTYGQPSGTTTALGGVTSGYDDTGLLRSVRDVNDLTTTLDYDTKGNLTRIRDDLGITLVTNTYNKFGDITSTTPVVGTTTYFDYDENGNRVATWSFDGTGASQVQILDLVRYEAGRVVGSLHAVLPAGNFITTDLAKAAIPVQYVKWTTRTDSTADGLVATQVDRNGQETSYLYDRRGLLVQTRTVAAGSTVGTLIRTYYDAAGQAVATTDPFAEGTTASLTGTYTVYDKAGRVTETQRVKGLVINLTGSGSLVEAILASQGTVVTNSLTHYDSAGRVDLTTDSGGLQTKTTYDNYGEAVESRTQSIDQTGQVVWLVTRTVYDAMGRAVQTTDPYIESSSDPIFATRTDYDSQGRAYRSVRLSGVVVSLSPVDHATSLTTPGTELWRTTTVYNSRGQIAQSIAANGQTTTYEYDQIGRQVAVIGTPVRIDGQVVSLRTETHFGDDGRVAWTQTNVRQYTNGTIDRSQAERTSYQYDRTGNVILTTYADGTTTSALYDDLGRKLSETNQLHQTRNFDYDPAGQLMSVTLPAVPDPNNNATPTRPRYEYGYDDQGNQTLIRDPLGHETRFTFDAQGNQVSRTLPLGYGPDGKLDTADDSPLPEGNFTETTQYDDQGRVIEQVSFEGVVTTFHYDTQTDHLASKQFFASTSAYANGTGTAAETWTYTYDAFGRTIRVVQADTGGASRLTTTDYDDMGRLAAVTTPEGTVNYRYDDLGRRIEMFTGTATAILDDILYGYDALGRLASVRVTAQNGIAIAANAQPTTTYGYGLLGNLVRKDLPNGGVEVYTYDTLNHLKHLIQYAPDASPANLADNPMVADYAYDLRDDGTRSGAVETFYFADNGGVATPHQSTSTWTYDDMGRLVDEVIDSYHPTLDQHEHFIYDLTGNRLEMTLDRGNDGSVDQDTTYQYDANDRLRTETQVTGGNNAAAQVTTYGYDHTEQKSKDVASVGSWLSRTTDAYDLQGHMAVVTTTTYANGTPGGVERTTYTYGADGILASELDETDADNDGTFEARSRVDYLNDAANATGYSQAVRVVTTNLVIGQVTKVVATTFGQQAIAQTTTTYVGGEAQAPTTFVLGHDGHGSTRVLTDATGQIAAPGGVRQLFAYDAYGNMLGMAATQAATSLLYSGEMFNSRIGQEYLRARFYDASNGRFNTADSYRGNLRDPESLNKYNYTQSDPVNGQGDCAMMGNLGR